MPGAIKRPVGHIDNATEFPHTVQCNGRGILDHAGFVFVDLCPEPADPGCKIIAHSFLT